jgi:hypothetical protein
VDKCLLVAGLVIIEKIGLIEDEYNRNTISLGRCKKTVYEGSRGRRTINSNHQKSLIYISRKDMTLLGEILRLTDDIVLTIINLCNKGSTLLIGYYCNTITYSHRISTADALKTEITLYLGFNQLAIVSADGIPAPCIFYN